MVQAHFEALLVHGFEVVALLSQVQGCLPNPTWQASDATGIFEYLAEVACSTCDHPHKSGRKLGLDFLFFYHICLQVPVEQAREASTAENLRLLRTGLPLEAAAAVVSTQYLEGRGRL